MDWKVTKAEVWLSSTDMSWERERDGLHQYLNIMVEADVIHAFATQWIDFGKRRTYRLLNIKRDFVLNQEEISRLFNDAYFNGEELA